MNIDALIFDFDGVVADTEAIHMAGFQEILAPLNIRISEKEYFDKYVGYDDRDGFTAILTDNGIAFTDRQLQQWISDKTAMVQKMLHTSVQEIPGAGSIIREAYDRNIPLAICSGALREEILAAAAAIGVAEYFEIIVSADDVARGKPDPEGYYLARRLVSEHFKRPVEPGRCVVCEDTPYGIAAARDAGMKVCGLATSHPPQDLKGVDRLINNFTEISLADLVALV